MKKIIIRTIVSLAIFVLAACGSDTSSNASSNNYEFKFLEISGGDSAAQVNKKMKAIGGEPRKENEFIRIDKVMQRAFDMERFGKMSVYGSRPMEADGKIVNGAYRIKYVLSHPTYKGVTCFFDPNTDKLFGIRVELAISSESTWEEMKATWGEPVVVKESMKIYKWTNSNMTVYLQKISEKRYLQAFVYDANINSHMATYTKLKDEGKVKRSRTNKYL